MARTAAMTGRPGCRLTSRRCAGSLFPPTACAPYQRRAMGRSSDPWFTPTASSRATRIQRWLRRRRPGVQRSRSDPLGEERKFGVWRNSGPDGWSMPSATGAKQHVTDLADVLLPEIWAPSVTSPCIWLPGRASDGPRPTQTPGNQASSKDQGSYGPKLSLPTPTPTTPPGGDPIMITIHTGQRMTAEVPGPSRPGVMAGLGAWTATHLRAVLLAWAAVLVIFGVFAPSVLSSLAGAGWQDSTSQSVAARN